MLLLRLTSKKLKLQLHKYKYETISTILILLVGLISISWFRGDMLISYRDFFFIPDRITPFFRNFYTWDEYAPSGLGAANGAVVVGPIPYELFRALSEIIGLPVSVAEKILFYVLFTSSGLSMKYLSSYLLKDKNLKGADLISAIFYMMNLYGAVWIWPGPYGIGPILWYSFLPLILVMYIKGLNERRGFKYLFAMLLIWMMVNGTSYSNPTFLTITWGLIFSYFLFYIVSNKTFEHFKFAFKFTTIAVSIWFILNAYWIIPYVYLFQGIQYPEALNVTNLLFFINDSSSFIGSFRLLGYWALDSGYKGDIYYVWSPPYFTSPGILISFITPILVFATLLFKPKNKYSIYFSILAILGLFLVKGPHSPLGEINLWFFNNFSIFQIFRSPYQKLGVIITLSAAFLTGVGIISFHQKLMRLQIRKRRFHRISSIIPAILIASLVIGINGWPFLTGDIVYPGGNVLPSVHVKIPDYYQEANSWLKMQPEDFKILAIPLSKSYETNFAWEYGYSGENPSTWILSKPTIFSQADHFIQYVAELLKNAPSDTSSDRIGKIIASINVKYVLLHEDINWELDSTWLDFVSNENIQTILAQQGLHFEKTFGKLSFYRNVYWMPLHIYSTPLAILSNDGLNGTTSLAENDDFIPGKSVLLSSNEITPTAYSSISSQLTIINNKSSESTTIGWIDDNFKEDWTFFAAQGAEMIWSTEDSIASLGINVTDGGPLVAVKRMNLKIDILEHPIMNVKAKTTNATMFIGMRFENSSGYMWDFLGSQSPFKNLNSQNAGWITESIDIYKWARTMGANDINGKIYLTAISYLTYNNGYEGIVYTYLDYISLTAYNITSSIYVPKDGNYLMAINVVKRPDIGSFLTKIDYDLFGVNWVLEDYKNIPAYEYVGPVHLKLGWHNITYSDIKGNIEIGSTFTYLWNSEKEFLNIDSLLNHIDDESVIYEKINPTKYVVHVNASKPFFLVFSVSYNKDWVAYVGEHQISNEYHFMANSYANAWYINKTGTYTVILEFWPQKLFYGGATLSITTLILGILYIYKNKIKTTYKRYTRKKSAKTPKLSNKTSPKKSNQ